MKLHNTLTRQIEEFKPLKAGEVSLYSCGPTVYDRVHIGNMRTYVFEDTLRRALKAKGLRVRHITNITDIDDKTIRRSQERFPQDDSHEALKKLTRHYEEIYLNDTKMLGIDLSYSEIVRATDYIEPMKELIKAIPYRYINDDGIFFDTIGYSNHDIEKRGGKPGYGVLTQTAIQGLVTETRRTDNDEYEKHEAVDFALWKARKPNEPSWDFEIDGRNITGRPGWHIECSAMSTNTLGQPFDIHTGGVDLIFPHHENEIAQSKSVNGVDLARFFVHGEHLLVDGRKMSKSLQNFYTVTDIVDKGINPLSFRLLMLQSHYRSQMNFTWDSLQAAAAFLKRLQAWADLRWQPSADTMTDELDTLFRDTKTEMLGRMSDDLDTPGALAALAKLVAYMQTVPIPGVEGRYTEGTLKFIDELLGLSLSQRSDISDEQKQIIADREEARQNGDWEKADQLRQKLLEQMLEINDTEHGPVWSRL